MAVIISEHDEEAVPGLPGELPAGEKMLWQGRPDWLTLAQRLFHLKLIVGYFVVTAAWAALSASYDGAAPLDAVSAAIVVGGAFAVGAVGLLALIAWLQARSTIYTVTSERVVMRFGAALPMTINVPFSMVESADVRVYPDGTTDIPLSLKEGERVPYAVLWPHARPWHFKNPTPMLRAVPNGEEVAAVLAGALAEAETARTTRPKISVVGADSRDQVSGLTPAMAREASNDDPLAQGAQQDHSNRGRSDLGHGPHGHSHENIAPKGALVAAGAMVGFAVLAVAASQLTAMN